MTINEAVTAIEALLATKPDLTAFQVRPSGDDVDVIKIWVDIDTPDAAAFEKSLEAEVRAAVPDAAAFRLQVRAESGM
jgi:hypothetical protein